MAQEIKNTFLKSKMNKDLDDRILPNGEYRDARNISVGRSEDSDVGALENVIGNDLVTGTDLGEGLTVIGVEPNNSTDEIFVFLTDYTDPSTLNPTNAPVGSKHYIYVYNNSSGEYTKLLQGIFLNFSTTNRILGINLLENLLFWTDNRNQPRKINVNLATGSIASEGATPQDYYTQEHQISVAKYNPYQAISLYNRADVTNTTTATSYITVLGDRVTELTAYMGALVVSTENSIDGADEIKITSVALQGSDTRVSVSPSLAVAAIDDTYFSFIQSTMTNKNDDEEWPGDPDYLEDRFVRFSYRFKFDDNEYSIMAPFTQIAYIPKQNGYFINGDEDSAYRSTIVDFMENLVQNIGLVIPLPTSANRITSEYKISELEILFRESDSTAVKVLESITAGEISGTSAASNYYAYDYQSRKPYRTLPEAQTVRVYDKVPVRAFSQESSGNRIIYGNYRDQHTPPANLNYNCRISPKSVTGKSNNFIEYPNHTVKRNRNYQAGFILADKFGRQSPVILSSVDSGLLTSAAFYSGSTIYSPYDLNPEDTNVLNWRGDAISLIINSPIASSVDAVAGTPGLYAIEQQNLSTGEGFAITGATTITETTYQFRLDATYPDNINIPAIGDFMRGYYEDFVKVTNVSGPIGVQQYYTVTTTARVNDSYLRGEDLPVGQADLKFAYSINDLGWYSYKIVVKQTEQEYYNVYLPGILNGYPGQSSDGEENGPFPNNETNLTAHAVLFNDNINKVPRDLLEVGDQDKQFRSSVTLYGRVTNTMVGDADAYNQQYYPRLNYTGKNAVDHMATTIATASDLDMAYSQLSGNSGSKPRNGNLVFYQIDSNPLIARISTTEKSIGAENTTAGDDPPYNMLPYLAVYETAPVESLLDIYWETTSEGLIVDLNSAIAQGSGGAVSFTPISWNMDESFTSNTAVTSYFQPIDREGSLLLNTTASIFNQTDGNNADTPINLFTIEQGTGPQINSYILRYVGDGETFINGSEELLVYTITIKVTTIEGNEDYIVIGGVSGGEGSVTNVTPSFSVAAGDIVKTNTTSVLLTSNDWLNPVNGSAINQSAGLIYSFNYTGSGFNPTVAYGWYMNPNNGELTQNTPPQSAVTPIGTYPIDLILTDASGSSGSISYTVSKNIILKEPVVNTGAKTPTCIYQPNASTDYVMGVKNSEQNENAKTGVWFIQDVDTADADLNLGIISDNTENKYRIGIDSHKSGTIALTCNIKGKNGETPGPDGGPAEFSLTSTEFYYRIVGGSNDWTLLPRVYEYNSAGAEGGLYPGVATPNYDFQSSGPGGTFNLSGDELGSRWLSSIRSFDYLTLNQESDSGIEYAIVIQELVQRNYNNNDEATFAFVIADDLHYPSCVPWQGLNAIPAVSTDGYKYFISSQSNDANNFQNIDETSFLYADTAYGEYVNIFYTDAARLIPYKPLSNTPYINFKLDLTYGNLPTLSSWTETNDANVTLQWVAGFSSATGVRLNVENLDKGVKTRQTTLFSSAPSTDIVEQRGTSRIKTELQNP